MRNGTEAQRLDDIKDGKVEDYWNYVVESVYKAVKCM